MAAPLSISDIDLAIKVGLDVQKKTGAPLIWAENQFWMWNGSIFEARPDVERLVVNYHGGFGGKFRVGYNLMSRTVKALQVVCSQPNFFEEAPIGVAHLGGFLVPDQSYIYNEAPDPKQRSRHQIPLNISPSGTPKAFIHFLLTIWPDPDHAQKVQALAEFLGLCLLGQAPRLEKCLFFYGHGANGKSVLCRVIEGLFKGLPTTSVSPKAWANEYYAAELSGSLLNMLNEIPGDNPIEPNVFKAILSGETITARPIRQAPMKFKPRAGHLITFNSLPVIKEADEAFFRRIMILEFTQRFDGSVPSSVLVEECLKEAPQIIWFCLSLAAQALRRNSYTSIPSSVHLVNRWKMAADQAHSFVAEATKPGNCPAGALYQSYRAWASARGHHKLSYVNFRARLEALGFGPKHSPNGVFYSLSPLDKTKWKDEAGPQLERVK